MAPAAVARFQNRPTTKVGRKHAPNIDPENELICTMPKLGTRAKPAAAADSTSTHARVHRIAER